MFLENLVALGDGSHAVTSFFDGRILRLAADGSTTLMANVPGAASGIERESNGTLIVAGIGKDERRMLWRVTTAGAVEELVHLQDAALPNGLTWLSPGVLLVAESVKGLIFRVDVAAKAVSVWKADPLLGGFRPQIKPAIPAVNGIKVHGGRVYARNMSLNHFVRIDTDRRVTVLGTREQGLQGATALSLVSDAKGKESLLNRQGPRATARGRDHGPTGERPGFLSPVARALRHHRVHRGGLLVAGAAGGQDFADSVVAAVGRWRVETKEGSVPDCEMARELFTAVVFKYP